MKGVTLNPDGGYKVDKSVFLTKEEERAEWEKMRAGDREARERLIASQMSWVTRIAAKVARPIGWSIEEAQSLAVAHFCSYLIDKFDPDRGRLTTLVGFSLPQWLRRQRNRDKVIVTPKDFLQQTPEAQELSCRATKMLSVDYQPPGGDDARDYYSPADPSLPDPSEVAARAGEQEVVQFVLSQLHPHYQEAVREQFESHATLEEIGEKYGYTRERSRQIIKAGLVSFERRWCRHHSRPRSEQRHALAMWRRRNAMPRDIENDESPVRAERTQPSSLLVIEPQENWSPPVTDPPVVNGRYRDRPTPGSKSRKVWDLLRENGPLTARRLASLTGFKANNIQAIVSQARDKFFVGAGVGEDGYTQYMAIIRPGAEKSEGDDSEADAPEDDNHPIAADPPAPAPTESKSHTTASLIEQASSTSVIKLPDMPPPTPTESPVDTLVAAEQQRAKSRISAAEALAEISRLHPDLIRQAAALLPT